MGGNTGYQMPDAFVPIRQRGLHALDPGRPSVAQRKDRAAAGRPGQGEAQRACLRNRRPWRALALHNRAVQDAHGHRRHGHPCYRGSPEAMAPSRFRAGSISASAQSAHRAAADPGHHPWRSRPPARNACRPPGNSHADRAGVPGLCRRELLERAARTAGLPDAVAQRLSAALNNTLARQDVRDRLIRPETKSMARPRELRCADQAGLRRSGPKRRPRRQHQVAD